MTNTQQNRTTICACIGIERVGKTDYCDNRLMSEIIKASGYHVLVSNPYSNARFQVMWCQTEYLLHPIGVINTDFDAIDRESFAHNVIRPH